MDNKNKANVETVFNAVWEVINSTYKNFQVMSNIKYYLNNNFKDNKKDNQITNFIKLAQNKRAILVPLKLVNVDVNDGFSPYTNHDNLAEELIRNILQPIFNTKLRVEFYFNSMHNQFPFYLEEDYDIKIDKNSDFAIVFFTSNSSEISNLIDNIAVTFQDYTSRLNTYKNVQECILRSDSNYHKLLNEKNKLTSNLERHTNKLDKIDNELSDIEESIINGNLIDEARNDFYNYKSKCFNSIFKSHNEGEEYKALDYKKKINMYKSAFDTIKLKSGHLNTGNLSSTTGTSINAMNDYLTAMINNAVVENTPFNSTPVEQPAANDPFFDMLESYDEAEQSVDNDDL
jgi:hypothetical protein